MFAAAAALSLAVTLAGHGAALTLTAGSWLSGPMQALGAAASVYRAGAAAELPAAGSAAGISVSGEAAASPAAPAGTPADAGAQSKAADAGAPSPAGAQAGETAAGGAADSVALLGDEARPENAGTVLEKTYAQGTDSLSIPCGAGTIRNRTRTDAAAVAAAAAAGLPFSVAADSAEPQVLILHTHATETYRLSAGLWFSPTDTARSTDNAVNMCAVGDVMARELNAAGICTLHDTTLNDYPSYTGSYANSRAVAQRYLAQYPSIRVILDVHRDAIETNGARIAPVCSIGGRKAAQVMLICGCGNGTTIQLPDCMENLRFAAAWERQMEADSPGLTRPVLFSYRFYNQDLSAGALLIEVGGHGNNLSEALYAGRLAAKSLAALLRGG